MGQAVSKRLVSNTESASTLDFKGNFSPRGSLVSQIPEQVRRETMLLRYRLQRYAGGILPKKSYKTAEGDWKEGNRVGACHYAVARNKDWDKPQVRVTRRVEDNRHRYKHLMACGSVWTCPVCASYISERRRAEFNELHSRVEAEGHQILFITQTFPHQREDSLKDNLAKFRKALKRYKSGRAMAEIRKKYGHIGSVRVMEVTHGQNGWHPHCHEMWYLANPVGGADLHSAAMAPDADDFIKKEYKAELAKFAGELYELWAKACEREGLPRPSRERGVHVQSGEKAADYGAKWGFDLEMTKWHIKAGKNGSRSPFQILESAMNGDRHSVALFLEYAEAFRGVAQLYWSKGLKDRYGIKEFSDAEVLAQKDVKKEMVGVFAEAFWKALRRQRRGEFLAWCDDLGFDAAVKRFAEECDVPRWAVAWTLRESARARGKGVVHAVNGQALVMDLEKYRVPGAEAGLLGRPAEVVDRETGEIRRSDIFSRSVFVGEPVPTRIPKIKP